MKPYFESGNITIYHGDCREILPSLPKARLVLTDPPYAIGAGRGEWAATAAVAIGLHEAAKRVTEDGALLAFSTSSGRGIEYTLGAIGKALAFNRLLVWHKCLGTSKAAGPWKWDLVSILGFGRCTFGTAEASSILATAEPRKGREHPAQVPFDVANWLYTPFSSGNTDAPVVDPFIGSGRLLMPAVRAGHRVVGIDVEEKWCELAVRNLTEDYRSCLNLSMEPALTPAASAAQD
jgi:DNA modification methylase